MDDAQIKEMVRARYGGIAAAAGEASCCGPAVDGAADKARRVGYSEAELAAVPDGANLGLGCGNPQAIAAMRPGETVIDLGSGAGFDCFLAAGQVGASGHAIGVDMTHEMLAKARANAASIGAPNVEFRLGELEHLLASLPRVLAVGGVAAFISFHSLEDRRVKHAFADRTTWEPLTKKPMLATDAERELNPRAGSAKLRAARLREVPT